MMESGFWTVIRALMMCASFIGLCAGLRVRLKLNRFVAPFAAVSLVITALMLCGMARILPMGFWALFALGFAGLVDAYFVKKARPEYGLIALMLAFAGILTWRFFPSLVVKSDDVGHWALVARHLLRYNAFPTAAADYVLFQSYPLGAASFIYYAEKFVRGGERMYFIAHNFLLGALFMPVFALTESGAKRLKTYFVLLFVTLFHFSRELLYLQVDLHLAFFGIGAAACIVHYLSDWKKAMACALPGMIAAVYFKNSGIFFAVLSALGLMQVFRSNKLNKKRFALLSLLSLGLPLLAYLLWTLHTKLTFPVPESSQHAVSLAVYAQKASAKSAEVILASAKNFLHCLFVDLHHSQLIAAMVMLAIALALIIGCKRLPGQRDKLGKVMKLYWLNLPVYALWLLMLFGVYVFSMTEQEALVSASFSRYNGTGLCYLLGMASMVLAWWADQANIPDAPLMKLLGRLCTLGLVLFVCGAVAAGMTPRIRATRFYDDVFARRSDLNQVRYRLMDAKSEHQLPFGGKYLVYCSDVDAGYTAPSTYPLRSATYEFESIDLMSVMGNTRDPQGTNFCVLECVNNSYTTDFVDDLDSYFARFLADCDAVILLSEGAEFEAQMNAFAAENGLNPRVIHAMG